MFGHVETLPVEAFHHNNSNGTDMNISTETETVMITVQAARTSTRKASSLEIEQEANSSSVMSMLMYQDDQKKDMLRVINVDQTQSHRNRNLEDPTFGLDVLGHRKVKLGSVWDATIDSNVAKSKSIDGIAVASNIAAGTGSERAAAAAENTTISETNIPSTAPSLPSTGTPQPTPMTTTKQGTIVMEKDIHTVVVGILITLIVILCIVLLFLILPWIRHLLRRRASTDKRKIKRRYQTVDSWLIIKEVVAHSPDVCSCTLPNDSSPELPPSCPPTLSSSIEETTPAPDNISDDATARQLPECSICMDGFPLHSLVAWSPIPQGCLHAFHKDCIREWLLRHKECPYCRQVMLPIDRCHGRRRMTHGPSLQAMSLERVRRYDETQYCQVHGVVEVVVVRTNCEDCIDGGSPSTTTIQESVGAAEVPSTNDNGVDNDVCTGQPQAAAAAASTIFPRKMVGDVLSGTMALEGNEDVPTEPPLPDMDDDMQSSFEPPLPSRMSDDAGVDVESQAIRY